VRHEEPHLLRYRTTMIVGTVKETCPGERRVALVPSVVPALVKAGLEVLVESGAGADAGYPDAEYTAAGATLAATRGEVFGRAEIVCQVRTLGANTEAGRADVDLLRSGQTLIGLAEPLTAAEPIETLAGTGAQVFGLELIPRSTRAQSMDVLSSQATVAGYEAVLMAAQALPKMFPMMMTAAGTLAPARVFVIGAGVAGLQAIASSKRMGAVVTGYDIRPVVKDQVESLGARFLEMEIEAAGSEDKGGYAKAMDAEFYKRQGEMMTATVAESDVVITTAAVPGKKAPVLITADMVRGMAAGSVVVDLASERGGNCELTDPERTVVDNGVTILPAPNLPAAAPYHASQMFAKNVQTFLMNMVEDGQLKVNLEDDIVEATLLTRDGQVIQPRVCEILGIGAVEGTAS
jgi:NAD(P) transhydrogenase subunit alpha